MKYFNNIFNTEGLYPLAKDSVQIINDNASLMASILDGLGLPNSTAVYLRGNVNGTSYMYIRESNAGKIARVAADSTASGATLDALKASSNYSLTQSDILTSLNRAGGEGVYENVLLEENYILSLNPAATGWRFYDIVDVFVRYAFRYGSAAADYSGRITVLQSGHVLLNSSSTVPVWRVSSDGIMHISVTLMNNTSESGVITPGSSGLVSFLRISGSGFPGGTGFFKALFMDYSNRYITYDAIYISGTVAVIVPQGEQLLLYGGNTVTFKGSSIIGL